MLGVSNPAETLTFIVAETEVFSGTSPNTWTDLDLSSVVGSKATEVTIKAWRPASDPGAFAFRRNGDTDEFFRNILGGLGIVLADVAYTNEYGVFKGLTDSAGILEWRTSVAVAGVTLDLMQYLN